MKKSAMSQRACGECAWTLELLARRRAGESEAL
jgi:hypothetical protein